MNALILNCSPARTGATAEICRLIQTEIAERFTVRAVCIDDFEIHYCRGCRSCHKTAQCVLDDGAQQLLSLFEWADSIVCVSPSYWADVPGQFKAFIDRCTPWCDTHEPHAELSPGKQGYTVALRTGGSMRECETIFATVEHFYGHLHIAPAGRLGLCGVENKQDVPDRREEILAFARGI